MKKFFGAFFALSLALAAGAGLSFAGDAATPAQGNGGSVSSASLDSVFGSARGDILYRGNAGWTALPPGTSGRFLKTLGAGADPAWADAATSLSSVLAIGNLTGGHDIALSTGDKITSAATITLNSTAGSGDVAFQDNGTTFLFFQGASAGTILSTLGTTTQQGAAQIQAAMAVNATSGTSSSFADLTTYGDAGTNSSTTVKPLQIHPTINFTAPSRNGHYEALAVSVVETSLPAGTNYFARFQGGSAGTTDLCNIQNDGSIRTGYSSSQIQALTTCAGTPSATNPGGLTAYNYNSDASNGDSRGHVAIDDYNAFAAGVGGGIIFRGNYNTSTFGVLASIKGVKENATGGNNAGALCFTTQQNGSTGLERARFLGSSSTFQFRSDAVLAFTSGVASAAADTGIARVSAGLGKITDASSTNYATIGNGGVRLQALGSLGFSSSADATAASDTFLSRRGGAGKLGLSNGVNPTIWYVFNTTDSDTGAQTNYERGFMAWSANAFLVGTESGGTGIARAMSVGTYGSAALSLVTGGTSRWTVDTSGNLSAASGEGLGFRGVVPGTDQIKWGTGGTFSATAPQILFPTDIDGFISAGSPASGSGRSLVMTGGPGATSGAGGKASLVGGAAVGLNKAAGGVLIDTGASTGNANTGGVGDIVFKNYTVGSSGSTVNTTDTCFLILPSTLVPTGGGGGTTGYFSGSNTSVFGWSSAAGAPAACDTFLFCAGGQGNVGIAGGSPTSGASGSLSIYNVLDSTGAQTNTEALQVLWSGNAATLATVAAGTGVNRGLTVGGGSQVAASTAGSSTTVKGGTGNAAAGGAASVTGGAGNGTDKGAGGCTIGSGLPTGAGTADVAVQTGFALASGTTAQTAYDRYKATGKTKALSTTTATNTVFALLSNAVTDSGVGCTITGTIELIDGTHHVGTIHFTVPFSSVNQNGTLTAGVVPVLGTGNGSIDTGGTYTSLTTTFTAVVSGTNLQLGVTPTWSAGTPTTARLTYQVQANGQATVAPQ